MRITQFFGSTSKNAQYMHYDLMHAHGTIYTRYERPSQAKIRAWHNIEEHYKSNNGVHEVMIKGEQHTLVYCDNLLVAGANSNFFSTVATFQDIDTNEVYIIKETHANTYMCKLINHMDAYGFYDNIKR